MTLSPLLRPQIDALLKRPFSGSCFKPLTLKEAQTSSPAAFCEVPTLDHFKLLIPYAGHILAWEIRFDSSCPEFAPDFLFDDELFLSYLDVDKLSEFVPSLVSWDIRRQECLREVIQQLLNLYTTYQIQRLESPLGIECDKCLHEFNLELYQLQVLPGDSQVSPYFLGSSTRPPHNTTSVLFLNLENEVSCNEMPIHLQQMALQFMFRDYSVCVACHASPALRHLLGDQEELEVPNYSKNDGLVKYINHFIRIAKETFSQVIQSYQRRERFHIGIYFELSNFDGVSVAPLENDMPQFTSSSFIVEAPNYSAMVIIKTPSNGFGDPIVSIRTLDGTSHDISFGPAWNHKKAAETVVETLFELREKNGNEV